MTMFTIVGFVMGSIKTIQAEDTTTTLKSGKEFNQIIQSLISEHTASFVNFKRAQEYDSDVETEYLSDDQKVLAWFDTDTVYWYSDATTIYMNANSSYMFSSFPYLTAIDTYSYDTSKVKNMSHMFDGDTSLATLDLETWNTASVLNMNSIFANMTSLTSLNVMKMNTNLVTDMTNMFKQDSLLSELDLSSFTVSDKTKTADMFDQTNLTTIYVSKDWGRDVNEDTRFKCVYPAYFEQNITMATDAEMQDITFTYSISPGQSIDNSSLSDEVKAGIVNDLCVVEPVTFTTLDVTNIGTPTDTTATDKKYIKKMAKILIDPTVFTEPGIYRYIITESTEMDELTSNLFRLDENTQRIFDVLVEYPNEQDLTVTSSVFHRSPIEMKGITLSSEEKNAGFTNSYLLTTNNLKIRNDYEGNMSDTRKRFTYHLTIDDDIPGRVLKAVYSEPLLNMRLHCGKMTIS